MRACAREASEESTDVTDVPFKALVSADGVEETGEMVRTQSNRGLATVCESQNARCSVVNRPPGLETWTRELRGIYRHRLAAPPRTLRHLRWQPSHDALNASETSRIWS